jgi:hypothetical protein
MRFALCSFRFSLLLCFAFVVSGAFAQSAPTAATQGGRPAGSYQLSDFDNVNLFNGNLNFTLPLTSAGGRGDISIPISFTAERRWELQTTYQGVLPIYSYYPNTIQGVMVNGPARLKGQVSAWNYLSTNPDSCGQMESYPTWNQTTLYLTLADGTSYSLLSANDNGVPHPVPYCSIYSNQNLGVEFVALDGSGVKFISDAPILEGVSAHSPTGYLLLPSGARYRFQGGHASWVQDRHGNRATFTYGGLICSGVVCGRRIVKITDSLGREVDFSYGLNQAPYGIHDKVEFNGFGGPANKKTIRITQIPLNNALRPGIAPKSTIGELFPNAPLSQQSQNVSNSSVGAQSGCPTAENTRSITMSMARWRGLSCLRAGP